MTERRLLSARGLTLLGLAVLAGACAGLLAVYVSGGFSGNQAVAIASCATSPETIEKLKGLAHGEVAAFRIADRPIDFSALAFKDPRGADTSLAAFAGRTVLVNIWASWCVPCRTEMPALDRLQGELGGRRFAVAAINIDVGAAGPERARAFFDRTGVRNLTLYSDPTTGVFKELKGRGLALGLPTTLLVDAKGCGIGIMQGPAQWDSEEAKALIGAAVEERNAGA
jgi:thiol-disulfide isomerase/thioredoxin